MVIMPVPMVVTPMTHEVKSDDESSSQAHENKLEPFSKPAVELTLNDLSAAYVNEGAR